MIVQVKPTFPQWSMCKKAATQFFNIFHCRQLENYYVVQIGKSADQWNFLKNSLSNSVICMMSVIFVCFTVYRFLFVFSFVKEDGLGRGISSEGIIYVIQFQKALLKVRDMVKGILEFYFFKTHDGNLVLSLLHCIFFPCPVDIVKSCLPFVQFIRANQAMDPTWSMTFR